MTRLVIFTLRLALLIALALWLADQPGTAHIVWHDTVIDTSAALLLLTALVIGYAFYLAFRLWHLLRHGPERWRLSRRLGKLQNGHTHLTDGFTAIAAGDAAEAGRLAIAARKHLGVSTLTKLLQAQAAELAGDELAARQLFQTLAADSATAALGYRGLIQSAQRRGDADEIERLTGQLRHASPEAPWLQLLTFEQATRRADWDAAQAALALLAPTRLLDPDRYRRYRAALALAQSQTADRRGDTAAAFAGAEQAARLAPHWLPALIAYAGAQSAAGHRKQALRLIEKNWAMLPHPQLAALYRDAHDDATEAYRQTEKLTQRSDDALANGLALGSAALQADLWGEARRHLQLVLAKPDAPATAYRLLAQLERRENNNEAAARQWLGQAGKAAADPAWICEACGTAHAQWQPVCRACGSFAALHWQQPRDAALQDSALHLSLR